MSYPTKNKITQKQEVDAVVNSIADVVLKGSKNSLDAKETLDDRPSKFTKKLDRVADTIYEKGEI